MKNIKMRKAPKKKNSSQTIEDILKGTHLAFEKFGLKKITAAKISELTGISVGSFYQYFPNKESLFLFMAKKISEKHEEGIRNIIKDEGSFNLEEILKNIIDFSIDNHFQNKNKIKHFLTIILSFNQIEIFNKTRLRNYKLLTDYLVKVTNYDYNFCFEKVYVLMNAIIGNIMLTLQLNDPLIEKDALKKELFKLSLSYLENHFNFKKN